MSKPLIELITCESGDWEVLRVDFGEDFDRSCHRLDSSDWCDLLTLLGYKVDKITISDEDMEMGNY